MFAKRDVFALLLSCFAVYYSTLSEGVVSFHPAFVVARDGFPGETAWDRRDPGGGVFASGDVDDPTDSGNARARDDRPPPPRFFDLNGDGVREMLVATGGGASGDEPTLRMVEMEERREEVRSDATSAYGANRNRQKKKKTRGARFSRSTREILAAEPRRGSAAFFGSADAFQRARVLARVSLLPERPSKSNSNFESGPKSDARDEYDDDGDVSGSRTPVAVGVGRVLPARNASSLNERRPSVSSPPVVHKGVVVVVTEGWHVVCFDHNLRVMWERALGKDFPKHAKPREAAVLVTAAALFKGDRGTVIVGGRVDLGVIDEEADTRGAFDPLNAELEREEAVRTRAGGERTRRENDSFPTFARHFNYYAFETGTGELRWKHESDDFHRDVRGLADALTPQHDHKLDAAAREASEGRHFGEAACREFRESVAASAMPHRWTGREDTRLALARFEHHKRAAKRRSGEADGSVKAETPETTTRKTRKTPSRDVASGEDGELFFTDVKNSDHLRPNAIVAHQEEGIEVVHLFGGRTLCKMLLTPLDAHADVNGDGVLEHVSARGGGGARLTAAGESFLDEKGVHEKEKHGDRACWARVSAGTPPRGAVFEGSICRGSMGVTRHARRDGGAGGDRADANAGGFISGNTVDVASPVALRRSRRDVRVASRLESRLASRRDGEARPPPDGRERSVSRLDSRRVSASDAARGAVFDLVFLNSRGEMTSYTHEGTRRWQLRTDSGWARGRGETPGLFAFPLRSASTRRETPRAPEEPFEMSRDGAETEVALAVGATRATFVTPSGYVLATLTLPARPIAPAVIEDVNGDGLNDVVLRTERGTFAWTQKSRVGAKPFAVLAGALCLLVGGVFVAQVAHAHATGTKRLVRSTEMRDGEGRKDRARRAVRALGKMFGRAGARGWYAARAVSASARAAGDALGGPRAFVSERVGIPRFVSHVVSRTTSSRPFSGPAARRPQPRPRGFASAGTPRDDRDATAVETDASATGERDAVTASNAVETEKKAPVTDASTPTPPTPSPRVPLDGTSSTETDGVHAVKVVQNTWWEALTMTPVYAFRATRAKWASAPAVAAAIDPGFDADAFSRLAAVGRDEVLRAYAANDMSRVRAMCTPAVFDAFQQSRIEYERNNLALRYDRSPSADEETRRDDPGSSASSLCSARLIDLRLARQEDTFTGDPEDDPVWVARRDRCRAFVNGVGSGAREATSVMSDGQTLAPEKTKTKTKFDSLESADAKPLRLVATVFAMDKTGSRWSIEDTVNGTVGITEDLRIQEWSFTRDLPRYWPSDEALETPWRVEHVG